MNSEKIKCDYIVNIKPKFKRDKSVNIWTYVFKMNVTDLVGQCSLGVMCQVLFSVLFLNGFA